MTRASSRRRSLRVGIRHWLCKPWVLRAAFEILRWLMWYDSK